MKNRSAFAFAAGEQRPRQFWRIYELGMVEVGEGLEVVEADGVVDEINPMECYVRDDKNKLSKTDLTASELKQVKKQQETFTAKELFRAAKTLEELKAAIEPLLFGAGI